MKHLNYLYYHKSSTILIVFFLGYFRIVMKCPFQWSILYTLFNTLKNSEFALAVLKRFGLATVYRILIRSRRAYMLFLKNN